MHRTSAATTIATTVAPSIALSIALVSILGTGCLVGDGPPGPPGSTSVVLPTDPDDRVNVHVGKVFASGWFCSGTLILPRVVVTAAHCFPAGPADVFETEGFSTAVDATMIHSEWTGGSSPNDIALLLLRDPAPFNVASFDDAPAVVGSQALVVGFGLTGENANDTGTRRSGTVRIDSLGDMLVTRPDPSTVCPGDSGGALFDGGRLIGVTSGTETCNGGRGLFTRIDRHFGFIQLQLQRWGLAAGTPAPACGRIAPGNIMVPGDSRWSCNDRFLVTHQTDGNVVLYGSYDGQLAPLWASGTSGQTSTSLFMQPDGNLVLYGPNGALWATDTWGNPDARAFVHDDGNFVIHASNYSVIWQTGTGGQ
jgi:hypothetical protein